MSDKRYTTTSRRLTSSNHRFLGRNHPDWQRRHPASDGWKLTPPIPGTQVGQDLYVDKIRGIHSDGGYGVFRDKLAATSARNDMLHLVFYQDSDDMAAFVKSYANRGGYKFHVLCPLPSALRLRGKRWSE